MRFERPHDPDSHHRAGTGMAHGAGRTAQGKAINTMLSSALYLGPCTVCGAARGDYEAKGAVQMAQDNFDCGLEEDPRAAPAALSHSPFLLLRTLEIS
jgi:hypothetical protein